MKTSDNYSVFDSLVLGREYDTSLEVFLDVSAYHKMDDECG